MIHRMADGLVVVPKKPSSVPLETIGNSECQKIVVKTQMHWQAYLLHLGTHGTQDQLLLVSLANMFQ